MSSSSRHHLHCCAALAVLLMLCGGCTVDDDRLRTIEVHSSEWIWPGAEIRYSLDEALPSLAIEEIYEAMRDWESETGVTFVEVDSPPMVTIRWAGPAVLCEAPVGDLHGAKREEMHLGSHCTYENIVHEMGHLIGLSHEHQRCDRDQHVTVHVEHIAAGKIHNFNRYCDLDRDWASLVPYDLRSIMHYKPDAFSDDGELTITPVYAQPSEVGSRARITDADRATVRELYREFAP